MPLALLLPLKGSHFSPLMSLVELQFPVLSAQNIYLIKSTGAGILQLKWIYVLWENAAAAKYPTSIQ